jgi:predicted nucleic acid-binding protein
LIFCFDSSLLIAALKKSEKHHEDARFIIENLGSNEGIASSLATIEVPGGLASSTRLPEAAIRRIVGVFQEKYHITFLPFEPFIEDAIELTIELRDLKRRFEIPTADLFHLATAKATSASAFITIDMKHMLRTELVEAFSKYSKILNPSQARAQFFGENR